MNARDFKEGGLRHRATITRVDVRYFAKHRRWRALIKTVWLTMVCRHYSERCQECGGKMHMLWWSPTPLWCELANTTGGGCICPRCYDRLAKTNGIRLMWTPMVAGRWSNGELTPTTNWWLSDTRDWLMMGEPDPGCFDRDRDGEFYPTQWPWSEIKDYFGARVPPTSNTWGRSEAPARITARVRREHHERGQIQRRATRDCAVLRGRV